MLHEEIAGLILERYEARNRITREPTPVIILKSSSINSGAIKQFCFVDKQCYVV